MRVNKEKKDWREMGTSEERCKLEEERNNC